jgi:hypothetical protein
VSAAVRVRELLESVEVTPLVEVTQLHGVSASSKREAPKGERRLHEASTEFLVVLLCR